MRSGSALLLLLLSTLLVPLATSAQTTAFTYQGFLTENGGPAQGIHDLRFTIYDAASAGGAVGSPVDQSDVGVTNGLFTVSLDFGASVFDGSGRWLDIAVRPGASAGAFTNLTPRQPITATPYAIKAANAMTVAMGTISDPSFLGTTTTAPLLLQVSNTVGLRLEYPTVGTVPNLVGGFSGNTVGGGTEGAVIAGGGMNGAVNSIGVSSSYSSIGGGLDNSISSNSAAATIAGGNLNDIGVNSDFSAIGGGLDNNISNNSFYATIAGGLGNAISVSSPFSAIGGGQQNSIAANSFYATIAGGWFNDIGVNSDYSAIGGGEANDIASRSTFATIAGGSYNVIFANSDFSTIGGGRENNIASNAFFSVIVGGYSNAVGVGATNALAAGYRAKANHRGTFVWADSTDADFASTSANQFLIRASGGVGIGTGAPGADLHIKRASAGVVAPSASALLALESDTSAFLHLLTPNNVASGILFGSPTNSLDASLRYNFLGNRELIFRTGDNSTRMVILTNGFVGIGNTAPTNRLMVVNARCDGSSWINASDRNLKQGFAPVDSLAVLAKVAALPIQSWSYKEQPEQKHVGPVAQDFRAAFGLGQDDTSIATVDADGVALAAIQGLNQKLADELKRKDAEIAALQSAVAELRRLVLQSVSSASAKP